MVRRLSIPLETLWFWLHIRRAGPMSRDQACSSAIIALILLLGSIIPVMADDTSKCKQQASRAIKIVPTLSERRTALVIGNAAYENSPLANTVNDACAIAAVLRKVG